MFSSGNAASPKQLFLLASIGTVVLACTPTESSVAPKEMKPPSARIAADLVSYATGNTIAIVGDDGVTYTLNVNERKIYASNNEVLELSSDQFDAVYPEFLGTLEVDPSVPGLEAIDPNYCVPSEGVYCAYGQPLPGDGSSPDYDLSLIRWERVEGEVNKKGKPIRRGQLGRSAGFGIMSGDMCSDVAAAAFAGAQAYRQGRTGVFRDAFQTATLIAAGVITRKVLAAGTLAAGRFATRVAERGIQRTQVSVLAFYWNSYNCNSQQPVTATGTFYYSGGGGGGITCRPETWYISFDGGQTWAAINVMSCYTPYPH